jgi:hydrogenase nickel incorporation protein HypB
MKGQKMCSVCGCGSEEVRIDGKAVGDHHHHTHSHGDHFHKHDHPDHYNSTGESNLVKIEEDILSKNDGFAAITRARFAKDKILALNLVSSPGSGKTMLLTETIKALKGRFDMAVIEGDQETENDAARIRETGVRAIQINTGRGCHLDAHMVGHAVDACQLGQNGVLFIENVGNLVCPAAFDLGEHHKVAILSVTEGEDKPLKYPDMFAASDLMVLTKSDLLPYLDFDVARCIEYARRVNPSIAVIELSARSGDGMALWLDWVEASRETDRLGLGYAKTRLQAV